MYQCPNCGGALKYNIPTKQLRCDYCETLVNPYDVDKESDGYETGWYEATYFACPQCGGEILTTDNAAAGFCSFCGASTILSSRISKEARPKKIIPFSLTKEDCKHVFRKHMKKAIFAPKAFKGVDSIESFRGIYMPYWIYKTNQHGVAVMDGEKSHRSGDYIITDHYGIKAYIESDYDGFYYDASSSFYDNISVPLAPFDVTQCVEFTPSFLSGFYADTPDVPSEVYENDALNDSIEVTGEQFFGMKQLSGYGVNKPSNREKLKGQIINDCAEREEVMLPVWFMSYRKGDRVAYATVNGQTGKVVSDVPISPAKYVLGSLLLSLPIFLILNFLFACIPMATMAIATFMSAFTGIVFCIEVGAIKKREANEGDKGLIYARVKNENINSRTKRDKKIMGPVPILIISLITIIVGVFFAKLMYALIPYPAFVCTIIAMIIATNMKCQSSVGEGSLFIPIASSLFTCIVKLISPVSDIPYYIASLFSAIAIVVVIISIIRNYNALTMRYLPQFNKQGGDDRA